jgi:GNAT superfamily N-acetyltransferase
MPHAQKPPHSAAAIAGDHATAQSHRDLNSADLRALDNPIWNALCTEQASLAVGNELARRYPADIGPLSGVPEQSDACYEQLRTLAGPGGLLGLFLESHPVAREGWTLVRGGALDQMIRLEPAAAADAGAVAANVRRLTKADAPAMVALAELTAPGPFRQRTIELGRFWGVFEAGRLVAMAGQRMHLPGFVEISAVCTHPEARSRGYARTLLVTVIKDIEERHCTPFLHVFPDNTSAIRLYEGLGFALRKTLQLAVLKNER